eukprot:gene30702-11629_t
MTPHPLPRIKGKKIRACVLIQKHVRARQARKRAQQKREERAAEMEARRARDEEEDKAAAQIQAGWRGKGARDRVDEMRDTRRREVEDPAARTVQRGQTAHQMDEAEAAETVQRAYRCYNARFEKNWRADRKHEKEEQEKRDRSATKIQCQVRQKQSRSKVNNRRTEKQRERTERQQREKADEEVEQAAHRRREQAEDAEKRDNIRFAAAAVIQRAYRCYNSRFMLAWKRAGRRESRINDQALEEAMWEHGAATKIQCMSRRRAARKEVQQLRDDRDGIKRAAREREEELDRAATKIQTCVRGYNARFERRWREERKTTRASKKAMKREEEERAFEQQVAAAEAARAKRERWERAAVVMQCAWRCYNARFQARWRKERRSGAEEKRVGEHKRDKAARKIQSGTRGHQARKKVESIRTSKAEAELEAEAATKIQCMDRAAQRIQGTYKIHEAKKEAGRRRSEKEEKGQQKEQKAPAAPPPAAAPAPPPPP